MAYSWSQASAIFTCLLIAFILREYRVPAVFVQFTGSMLLVALFNLFQPSGGGRVSAQQVAYSDFLNEVNYQTPRSVHFVVRYKF